MAIVVGAQLSWSQDGILLEHSTQQLHVSIFTRQTAAVQESASPSPAQEQ